MHKKRPDQISIQFITDTPTTVSLETANQLVDALGTDNIETLIHQALSDLAVRAGLRYPSDEGLPTSAQMEAMGKLVPQDQEQIRLKSLSEQVKSEEVVTDVDQSLANLISGVTEDNKHSHIGFGKPVGKEQL